MNDIRYLGHDLAGMRALYGVSLADMGQKLSAQLAELSARPSRDACDRMIRELAEASTAVHRMRSRLERGEAA